MKKTWKNVLGVIAIVAVSVGAAVGTSFYLTNKNLSAGSSAYSVETEYGFKQQPFHYANYNTVAAENIDFTVAAESSIHAVVHIKATTNASQRGNSGRQQYIDPFEYFFGFGGRGQGQPQPRVGAGSGVIISVDGYIMTNNHVIDGADEIEVTLNDNRKFPAKVVGADAQTDIALIKIDTKDLPTIPFGDSEKLKVGEWVLAIGNPFNLTSTVTAGIVSAKGRGGISRGTGGIESFIQTDAAVNPGNSGGALVNTKGELVGINTAIYSETGNFAGYSFAVPISIAGKVASDLKQFGVVQRAILGVMMQDIQNVKEEDKSKLKVTEGAYVAEFAPYSSAKEAGMEAGDVIVAVNGVKIRTASALQEQISKFRPGDKVKVDVDRYGKELTFNVELRNAQGNTEVVKSKGDVAEVLGAAFKELTDKQKQQLGISYGVEVTGVTNGKMKDVGITKGYIIQSVNDQRVSTPDDVEKMVERVIKSGGTDQALFIKGIYPNRNNSGFKTVYYAINLAD